MRYAAQILAILACGLPTVAASADALPAFPGAEGFGATTVGGRGGRVIEVTNLHDAGPGSFRAAVEAEGPRVVVFRVGGTIELMTEIVVRHPFLTIAGQTAPGGGITLKTHPSNHRSALTLAATASDVAIRFIRSRPGPHDGFPPLKSGRPTDTSEIKDALQILGAKRVVVDHCSFSWATDEVVSTYFDAQDVTIQRCIIAEALRKSRPDQELPGKGLLIGSKGGARVSVHHNLMAHNVGRNPLVKTAGLVDVVNNVVLAPESVAMAIDDSMGESPANLVGNMVCLPSYTRYKRLDDEVVPGLIVTKRGRYSLFLDDNRSMQRWTDRMDYSQAAFIGRNNDGRSYIVNERHEAPSVTTMPALETLQKVLDDAGCVRPLRDAVDERIVNDVREGRARTVDRPEDVGGWPELASGSPPADGDRDGMPDEWERSQGLNPQNAEDGALDGDRDGYTNLEEYLNEIVERR